LTTLLLKIMVSMKIMGNNATTLISQFRVILVMRFHVLIVMAGIDRIRGERGKIVRNERGNRNNITTQIIIKTLTQIIRCMDIFFIIYIYYSALKYVILILF